MSFQLGRDQQCAKCYLRSLCAHADAGAGGGLMRHALLKREALFQQENECQQMYWLCSGAIKLERREGGGGVAMLTILTPGQLIGQEDLFAPAHFASATALQDSVVTSIAKDKFRQLLRQNGELAESVIEELALWTRQIGDHYARCAYSSTRRRLAAALLELSAKRADMAPRSLFQSFRLSRTELGTMIGASPETISRQLKAFKREGLLQEKRKGEFILLDQQRLRRIGRNWNPLEKPEGDGHVALPSNSPALVEANSSRAV